MEQVFYKAVYGDNEDAFLNEKRRLIEINENEINQLKNRLAALDKKKDALCAEIGARERNISRLKPLKLEIQDRLYDAHIDSVKSILDSISKSEYIEQVVKKSYTDLLNQDASMKESISQLRNDIFDKINVVKEKVSEINKDEEGEIK